MAGSKSRGTRAKSSPDRKASLNLSWPATYYLFPIPSRPHLLVLVHRKTAGYLCPPDDSFPMPPGAPSSDREQAVHRTEVLCRSAPVPQHLKKKGECNCSPSSHAESHCAEKRAHGSQNSDRRSGNDLHIL